MDELTKLIGAPPSTFNYDSGTIRYQNLTRLDPNNYYLIPPPGAPKDTVSVKACELLAGPGYGTYGRGNTLDAIGTWVVPLLVLVGNVNYASFSSHKYWNQITVVLQLFGNPIHAIWALLLKLDVKRRCEARCRAELKGVKNAEDEIWIYSTLLYALDDFAFSERFDDHFEILMCIAKSRRSRSKTACRRAAVQLTLSRVNNTRRALFAILGYLAAITANVLRAVFSETIQLHISHTIALRELNFWLISAIILSARVGGFPSEWEAVRVLLDLQSQLKEPRTNQRQTIGPERKRYEFGLKRLEPWTGGNYTYRPKKDNSKEISGFSDYRFLILASLAFASVTIAMLTSLWMSYLTPTSGIGVRSIVELSYWAWWCFNAGLTYAVDQIGGISKRKWLYTIGKDGVSAVFTIVFLFSAWSGWWNSCHHWSMAMFRKEKAYIDLVNMKSNILGLMKKRFPIILGVGFGLQLALVAFMIWYSQGTLTPPAMKADEPDNLFLALLDPDAHSNPSPAKPLSKLKRSWRILRPQMWFNRSSTRAFNEMSATMEEGESFQMPLLNHEADALPGRLI